MIKIIYFIDIAFIFFLTENKRTIMRKFIATLICFIILILIISSCNNEGLSPKKALQVINKDKILNNVNVLSADSMFGRAPGTVGEIRASNYIAKQFNEIGLKKINDSYFQSFNMIGTRKIEKKSSLVIKRHNKILKYISDETLTYWSSSQKKAINIKNAPIIFVGYGVQAKEYNWDDIKGYDLKGKILLFLNNDPPVTENGKELFKGVTRTYYGRWTYKFEQAMKLGAAGVMMIHTTPSASYPWSVVQHNGSEEKFAIDLHGSGYQVDFLSWIDKKTSNKIAKSMGTNLEGLFKMSAKRNFRPIDTGYKISTHIESEIRKVKTRNIWGILHGSDPELKKQIIVYTAHYDHLGKNDNLKGKDKIYNGAWDNALGVSSIMNIAEAFFSLNKRPKRSILFLACAAEESGTLGSEWFVNSPPFKRSQLVANINIDMPQIFGITSDISAIGVDMNSLGKTLREVAKEYKVKNINSKTVSINVVGDTNPNAGSFYRSDQVNFAKFGIPAIAIRPGKNFIEKLNFDTDKYRDSHYHQLIDEVDDKWDLSGCERDMRVMFEVGLKIANAKEMPRWVEGNEFESIWNKLHNIN